MSDGWSYLNDRQQAVRGAANLLEDAEMRFVMMGCSGEDERGAISTSSPPTVLNWSKAH